MCAVVKREPPRSGGGLVGQFVGRLVAVAVAVAVAGVYFYFYFSTWRCVRRWASATCMYYSYYYYYC